MSNLPSDDQIIELWLREFSPKGACCLCGNEGIIDTTGRVRTQAGKDVGARVFCICPNGRVLKRGFDQGAS